MTNKSHLTEQAGQGWQDIASAPTDGTLILLTAFEQDGTPFGEEWPMQWAHIQRNGLFPENTGMWTAPDGSLTWNGAPDDCGPTHWKPLHERASK